MNMRFKLLLLCWHIFYDTINLPFAAYNAMFTDLRVIYTCIQMKNGSRSLEISYRIKLYMNILWLTILFKNFQELSLLLMHKNRKWVERAMYQVLRLSLENRILYSITDLLRIRFVYSPSPLQLLIKFDLKRLYFINWQNIISKSIKRVMKENINRP